MELLDTLRALRQSHSHLRMVFTGTIGLHHRLHALKRSGYANDPTNDMDVVEVPPLAAADAQELALLDVLANAPNPLSFAELFTLTKTRLHYVAWKAECAFCFGFPLIQRWWRGRRGLV